MTLEVVISAFVSLAIGTLLGSEITRWLYRPRVFIRYEDTAPLHTKDGVHWTIKVANVGRTQAIDCKGIITIYGVDSEDLLNVNQAHPDEILPSYSNEKLDLDFPRTQVIDPKYFRNIDSESLTWAAMGNPPTISINPGITEMIDVFKVQNPEAGGYVIVPSEAGWRRLRARIKPKLLRGKIMICPSNEFPTMIFFQLSFDSEGRSSFTVQPPGIIEKFQRTFFRRDFYFG